MPLLQKLLVSGFAPSLGKTLGTFHKALTELTIGSFFLSLSTSLGTQSLIPLVACILLLHPYPTVHPYPPILTLSRLHPSLKILLSLDPLRFLSTSSLQGPSPVPQSKRLLCIISSRLLPLYGFSSPTTSLQLSASCLNPNSRHS